MTDAGDLEPDDSITCEACGSAGIAFNVGEVRIVHAAHETGCPKAVDTDAA